MKANLFLGKFQNVFIEKNLDSVNVFMDVIRTSSSFNAKRKYQDAMKMSDIDYTRYVMKLEGSVKSDVLTFMSITHMLEDKRNVRLLKKIGVGDFVILARQHVNSVLIKIDEDRAAKRKEREEKDLAMKNSVNKIAEIAKEVKHE